jgi:glycosyltransferase involved in cell wall biosynthesis
MFVFNDVTKDARVLREATTLAEAGYDVTIVGRPSDLTETRTTEERRDGLRIVRVPVPGAWRDWWVSARDPWRAPAVAGGQARQPIGGADDDSRVRARGRRLARTPATLLLGLVVGVPLAVGRMVVRAVRRVTGRKQPPGGPLIDWLLRWRFATLGWARDAAAVAPPAAVYHGHDLTALPAAAKARRAHGGALVYDSHEIFMESGSNVARPWLVRRLFERLERGWARQAVALVTVNRSLADRLVQRLRIPRAVIVHNAPARWTPPEPRPDLLRQRLAIPEAASVALYHGAFTLHRGVEQLAEALLEPGLEVVHGVLLGYGAERERFAARAAEERFGGRLHLLDAVPPDELLVWVASADVAVVAIQPSTLNHRLSTPNKLFEALAAGVPVVASDFPEIRRIVADDPDGPLGELCDPTDVAAIASAIRSIVELPEPRRADLRARCLRAAHERWNWETESARLLELYADLTGWSAAVAR